MKTLNTLRDWAVRAVMRTGIWVLVSLAFIGCAQFQHKLPEALPFMERAQTKTDGEVRITVAVPSAEESKEIFGFPLAGKNIQPVWLEVENNSDTAFFLYHLPMDPDFYSSGEVAWKFQSSLYSNNSQKNIYNLFRDNEIDWFFKPGTTNAGFVYTNMKMGTKAVLVRLFAEKKVKEICFFCGSTRPEGGPPPTGSLYPLFRKGLH